MMRFHFVHSLNLLIRGLIGWRRTKWIKIATDHKLVNKPSTLTQLHSYREMLINKFRFLSNVTKKCIWLKAFHPQKPTQSNECAQQMGSEWRKWSLDYIFWKLYSVGAYHQLIWSVRSILNLIRMKTSDKSSVTRNNIEQFLCHMWRFATSKLHKTVVDSCWMRDRKKRKESSWFRLPLPHQTFANIKRISYKFFCTPHSVQMCVYIQCDVTKFQIVPTKNTWTIEWLANRKGT